MEMETDEPQSSYFAGSTIGGANSSKKSDVLALEHCSFRVPFEELDVTFRQGQKNVERHANQVQKAARLLSQKVANATSPIEKAALRKNVDYLLKQVRDAKKAFNASCDAQIEQLDKMINRGETIHKEFEITEESSPRLAERLERQQHGRYIVWHLLRCGYIESARAMAEEMNLEELVDLDVFEKIHEIEKAILEKNTLPCLQFIERHKSRFKKMNSKLEVLVRQRVAVEMVEEDEVAQALVYVKKYLTPIAKAKFPEELTKIMGYLMCAMDGSHQRYPELHTEDRWEKLAAFFMKEAYELYELREETAFSSLLQVGISVFKTPSCKPDHSKALRKIKCFVCRPDIWPLAENLPYARVENSRILCSMSGELCDDDENIPFLFPSGHVFGKKSVDQLRRGDNEVYDPVNKKMITDAEVLRLYFL